jgi:hypothetical protein
MSDRVLRTYVPDRGDKRSSVPNPEVRELV